MADIDKVYDVLNEYSQELELELADAKAEIDELLSALRAVSSEFYTACHLENGFDGKRVTYNMWGAWHQAQDVLAKYV